MAGVHDRGAMRLLVLGGTMFLSEAVAVEAVTRGHEVVCACRGTSPVPAGARLAAWDRSSGDPAPDDVFEGGPDAVVDVARLPSWVRTAVASYGDTHWVFVSTINVYADTSVVDDRLVDAVLTDEEVDQYGAMKVGCEQLVLDGAASAAIVRPGLIVGPGDPTGRFSYWPERMADPGPALAGGAPTDIAQVIDVRDLAAWIVTLAEERTRGVFDGVGPAMPIGDLLAACGPAELTWAPDDVLEAQGVDPWSGPDALPLWLPRPEYDGMLARDVPPSVAAGLTVRPVAETAADTLAWLRAHPEAGRTGISREREAELLAALARG